MRRRLASLLLLSALAVPGPVLADDGRAGGKLVLTDGIATVEGGAGGGLTPWATIAGNETNRGIGGTAHLTTVLLPDFTLTGYGAALGFHDRVEISYARQDFDTRAAGAALGLGRGFTFSQDIWGAKLKVAGDAIWDQDRPWPQVAIGMQHKRATRGAVISAVGGAGARGTDLYVSATKLFLAQGLLVNATLRATRANQFGLLGFGGDRRQGRTIQPEGSLALMLSSRIVIGAEYRGKPDRLRFAREDDALDAFVAWAPDRHLTLTAAYVDLGAIATMRNQRGLLLSAKGAF